MKFDYVMVVPTIKEAEYHARELGLKRANFEYCVNERDIVGERLPTNKLFFISEKLYEEMSYFSDDKFYYRLHDRFEKILHLFGKELSRVVDVSHKAAFNKSLGEKPKPSYLNNTTMRQNSLVSDIKHLEATVRKLKAENAFLLTTQLNNF